MKQASEEEKYILDKEMDNLLLYAELRIRKNLTSISRNRNVYDSASTEAQAVNATK